MLRSGPMGQFESTPVIFRVLVADDPSLKGVVAEAYRGEVAALVNGQQGGL